MSNWSHKIKWDPTVSPESKREIIRSYARYGTLVETGTNDGGTPLALKDSFTQIYTIELIPQVHLAAQELLSPYNHITCLQGDSTDVIPHLLEYNRACVWWLDGHWSGAEMKGALETPVRQELEMILNDPNPHIVLVDDARLFGFDPNYPTVDWVRNFATTRDIRYDFSYQFDIMRIVPR